MVTAAIEVGIELALLLMVYKKRWQVPESKS